MNRNSGFTIIEVTLFVSITGLLMAALLGTIWTSVNRERYNESVESALDYIQGQFSLALNVQNSREGNYTCTPGNITPVPAGGDPRGQSTCSVVGRLIRTNANADSYTSVPVYATADITAIDIRKDLMDSTLAENTKLSRMDLQVQTGTDDEAEVKTLPWQTHFSDKGTTPASSAAKPFSMLIVRMPYTNTVATRMVTGAAAPTATIGSLISAGSLAGGTHLCIEPAGLVGSEQKRGIFIPQDVSNIASITYAAAGKACV